MARNEEVVAVVGQIDTADGEDKLSHEVSIVERQAMEISITNDDEYRQAAEFGRFLKQKSSEVTEFFKPMKKAAHDAHKHICDREKAMITPIANAEKVLKRVMGEYQMEQQRKQREEEERLRRLAREEEERLLKKAIEMEEQGDTEMCDEHFENAQYVAEAAKNISVGDGPLKVAGTSVSVGLEIESIDISKVPVEFMHHLIRPVDEKAVLRLIKEHKGEIEIPGIKFKQTTNVSFRK